MPIRELGWSPGDPPRLFEDATLCATCGEPFTEAGLHYVLVRLTVERPAPPDYFGIDPDGGLTRTSYVMAGAPVCGRECADAGATQIVVLATEPTFDVSIIVGRPTEEDLTARKM